MNKRLFFTIFLLAILIVGLATVGTLYADTVRAPVIVQNDVAPLTATAPVPIANTNSVVSLQLTHQVIIRLPNGTLSCAFSTNLLGTNNYSVYVVSSNDNGSTWGAPVKISNAPGMNSQLCNQGIYGCVIAADANNNIYVAWTGVNDSSTYFQVWCARYDGSSWNTPVQVSQGSGAGVQAFYVSIAVDGNNVVHLVWDSFINGFSCQRIFYSKYNGTWSSPTPISTEPNNQVYEQMYPDIAVDGNNSLHVVWYGGSDSSSGQSQIWYANYNGSWQIPVDISACSILNNHIMTAPCLAVDINNNIQVVWSGTCDGNPNYSQIWYANCSTVGGNTLWSMPVVISNADGMASSSQVYPTIAVDSQNRIHVAWMSSRENAIFYTSHAIGWSTPVQIEAANSSYPHFRWSFYPISNQITTNLDYVFLNYSVLTFHSGLSVSALSVSLSPLSEEVCVGQSVTFTAAVTGGTPPYNYTWYINGGFAGISQSSTWTYSPTANGDYNIYVVVTDSTGQSTPSETCTFEVVPSSQVVTGTFGYSNYSSMAGGSGTLYTATGSRFLLNVDANVTSMTCLMDDDVNPSQSDASYVCSYAIYSDSNGAVGNLVAQAEPGQVPNAVGSWKTLYFAQPVHLTPAAYWLMVVHNGSQFVSIHKTVTGDNNEIVESVLTSTAFPYSLNSPIYTFGQVNCIYASWQYYSGTTPTPTPSPTPAPTGNPTPQPTSNPTPTPQPTPTPSPLPTPTLTVNCVSFASLNAFKVQIKGNLTANGTGIVNAPISICYSVNDGFSWHELTSTTTGTDGSFTVEWLPSATGNYVINATFAGDLTYSSTSTIVNLVVAPYTSESTKEVFSATSNSTVSNLAFNSTSGELSFSVSGERGTSGYVDVCIAKSLISDISTVKAYLDGKVINYEATQTDTAWILHFTYHHSTHTITINLDQKATEPATQTAQTIIAMAVTATAIAIAATAIVIKKKHANSK